MRTLLTYFNGTTDIIFRVPQHRTYIMLDDCLFRRSADHQFTQVSYGQYVRKKDGIKETDGEPET